VRLSSCRVFGPTGSPPRAIRYDLSALPSDSSTLTFGYACRFLRASTLSRMHVNSLLFSSSARQCWIVMSRSRSSIEVAVSGCDF
jgi:hypothetical protein